MTNEEVVELMFKFSKGEIDSDEFVLTLKDAGFSKDQVRELGLVAIFGQI